jgi:hypothetical protein
VSIIEVEFRPTSSASHAKSGRIRINTSIFEGVGILRANLVALDEDSSVAIVVGGLGEGRLAASEETGYDTPLKEMLILEGVGGLALVVGNGEDAVALRKIERGECGEEAMLGTRGGADDQWEEEGGVAAQGKRRAQVRGSLITGQQEQRDVVGEVARLPIAAACLV